MADCGPSATDVNIDGSVRPVVLGSNVNQRTVVALRIGLRKQAQIVLASSLDLGPERNGERIVLVDGQIIILAILAP